MKKLWFSLLLVASLVACSYQPTRPSVGDGPPLIAIGPDQVKDAVPVPELVLAAGNTSPYVVNGERYTVLESADGYRESGIASWYGRKFHGRKTATGEVFDAYLATAAHRSLPIPSYVRVTNLENALSMVVKVNDRGPFHSERLIDLSYGAAVKLGFVEQGTAEVEIVALSVEGSTDLRGEAGLEDWRQDYRHLQLGSFRQAASADSLARKLRQVVESEVSVVAATVSGRHYYRVRVGPINDRQALMDTRQRLENEGFGQAKLVAE